MIELHYFKTILQIDIELHDDPLHQTLETLG